MRKDKKRYREMVRFMELVMLGDGILFVLSLVAAGTGIGWLRVILRVLTAVGALGGLAILYLNREIRRPRSRWIVAVFAAVLLCLLVSTVCNYPSPYVSPLAKTAAVFAGLTW